MQVCESRWRQEGLPGELSVDNLPEQRHHLPAEAGEQDAESQTLKENDGQ